MSAPVGPYVELCKRFGAGEMTPACFEALFLVMFKSEKRTFGAFYHDVNELFWAVDSYCSDPEIRESTDLDEEQLRRAANDFVASVRAQGS
ncbi:colicin immunity domain-containing protein [Salinactinospora qingdaonensis]|uniref:Colicin D immunity protein domain-containing protein n=1 Tax=Salinactinospora qingdaonensis TaxID=702744 RepID=A0ABP7F8K4_9ACTN